MFSIGNRLYPGEKIEYLPALTQTEEMLIPRVHVFNEVRQVKGQQYIYKGHIINL